MEALIEKHLYQRQPNLLIEKVEKHDQLFMESSLTLKSSHPLIQGHFPGMPVLPGTQMIELVVQTAGLHMSEYFYPRHREEKLSVGIFKKSESARFNKIVRPDQKISCVIEFLDKELDLLSYKGSVFLEDGSKAMSVQVKLATIKEEKLKAL